MITNLMDDTLDPSRIGQTLALKDDFSDTDIGFGDYIRLTELKVGDLIYLKDKGNGVKVVLIGNGTPFEDVNQNSENGWDYKSYNCFKVWRVYRLELEKDGSWLTDSFKKVDFTKF